MRADYEADKFAMDLERAERAKRCPIAAALREEIVATPWRAIDGSHSVNALSDAYEACTDALESRVDLTPAEVARLRQMARLEAK